MANAGVSRPVGTADADTPAAGHRLSDFVPTLTRAQWLALLRPGDILTLALLAALTLALLLHLPGARGVDRAQIRRDGKLVAEVMLAVHKRIAVAGPLGTTVIEIAPGRARVAADPGARQICVRQGWLDRANATALCLPNHVSLQVLSGGRVHDSLAY